MDIVAHYAAKHADKAAIIDGERRLSWREFFLTCNRIAHSLDRLGLAAGEHAVVYAPNSADNLLAGSAVRALGAVSVPLNHRLTADEVTSILDHSDAAVAFVGDAFVPVAERVRARPRKYGSGSCSAPSAGRGRPTWTRSSRRAAPIRRRRAPRADR